MLNLPLKLMVSVLIVGLMLPCMVTMVDRIQTESEVSDAVDCAMDLRRSMYQSYRDGPGCWRTVDVHIPTGYSLSVGGDGTEGHAIRIIREGHVVDRIYIEGPVFPVYGPEQSISGTTQIRLEPVMDGGILKMGVTVG